jgi:prefoldin subunit 5
MDIEKLIEENQTLKEDINDLNVVNEQLNNRIRELEDFIEDLKSDLKYL